MCQYLYKTEDFNVVPEVQAPPATRVNQLAPHANAPNAASMSRRSNAFIMPPQTDPTFINRSNHSCP